MTRFQSPFLIDIELIQVNVEPDEWPKIEALENIENDMFEKPSLTHRIAIGKAAGSMIGLLGFIVMPYFWPDSSWMMRFGILFWYTTVGAVVGMFGVYTRHPVLHLPLPWWFRSTVIGAWMNFVLVLLMYESLTEMMLAFVGTEAWLASPFWLVAEGAVVGILIGFLATRYAGEGAETLIADAALK